MLSDAEIALRNYNLRNPQSTTTTTLSYFPLQTPESGKPPTIAPQEAAILFKALYTTVERWVLQKLETCLKEKDAVVKEGDAFPRLAASEFLSLISEEGRRAFGGGGMDVHLVVAGILRFLCQEVLEKDVESSSSDINHSGEAKSLAEKMLSDDGMLFSYQSAFLGETY